MITCRSADSHEIHRFQDDGFCILEGCLPPQVTDNLLDELENLSRRLSALDPLPQGVELARMPGGQRRPARVEPVIPHSAWVQDLVRHPSLLALAQSFLGEPAVLLEDKLIFKPPLCLDVYPPHQEWWWTQEYSLRNLMLVIPLNRCEPGNGPLFVVPGSHKEGLLSHVDDVIPEPLVDRERGVPLLMKPGDVAVVSGGVIHYSAENPSESLPRHLLLLSYNGVSEGDCYARHREKWSHFYSHEGAYLVPEDKR